MAHDVSLNGVLRRYFSVKVYSTCGVAMDDPDPREDPKSRSLNGGSYKVSVVVYRSSRGSGEGLRHRMGSGLGFRGLGFRVLRFRSSEKPTALKSTADDTFHKDGMRLWGP